MRRFVAFFALLALVACGKEKEVDPPAELVDFRPTLTVQRVWSAGIGGGEAPLRLGLGLGVDDGRVYAAGHDGEVAAFELRGGRSLWRTRTRARLSGGTGAGHGAVAVGSVDGEVIVLDAASGAIRWRVRVGGEVLSAPAIAGNAVVVRTVDGSLRGLALADGRELWLQEQPVPRLSLRGTSRPVIAGELAICGFDNGRVLAVSVESGDLLWETALAPARGRTELERLVDIDSAVRVDGQDVYAVGFQGRAALLALDSGQVWWSREFSSHRGLGLDDDALYLSSADGEVVRLRRRTGAEVWRQDMLRRRGLSAPVVSGESVVVGDFQGFVHWLDKATGAPAARASSGGTRISSPPVAAGDLVLLINDEGRISAFRASPLERARPAAAEEAPAPAPQPAEPAPGEAPPGEAA